MAAFREEYVNYHRPDNGKSLYLQIYSTINISIIFISYLFHFMLCQHISLYLMDVLPINESWIDMIEISDIFQKEVIL